jgi:hypothetical protein
MPADSPGDALDTFRRSPTIGARTLDGEWGIVAGTTRPTLRVRMATKLDGSLKREIEISGTAYTLTIDPHKLSLVLKGKRKGFELEWSALVSGEAALATALNASLMSNLGDASAKEAPGHSKSRRRL